MIFPILRSSLELLLCFAVGKILKDQLQVNINDIIIRKMKKYILGICADEVTDAEQKIIIINLI